MKAEIEIFLAFADLVINLAQNSQLKFSPEFKKAVEGRDKFREEMVARMNEKETPK